MKKGEKEVMDIVFLLDCSGSMGGMEEDTIGGYNSYIDKQKKNKVKVTTILFDNQYEMLTEREDIKNISYLDNAKYFVRGTTALLDAIGKTINYMDHEKCKKVLFVITTDGLENASIEFNKDQIREMINKHKNWEFMYIGADIDSYNEGEKIGIKKSNIANYQKSKVGISKLFNAVSHASNAMYETSSIASDWKDELK